ncbi:MAG: hypothetical protein HY769_08960 [Candidatus Stahlbacteria bacterium]|nr:hypothetical protein [Candidatus Stahlbacteria bacterium]
MDKEREYKLKSLDVEDIEQVCNLIRGFRIAMSNMLLYPSGSDLINASVSTDEAILSNILEKYQILILSEVEGSLLANTVRLDAEVIKGAFMESLDACNI